MDNTPDDGAFSVILCLFSLQYTKYSCVKQSSSDEKSLALGHIAYFKTRPILEKTI